VNHFELFGLAPSVDLDVKALEQRHRDLSLTVHPDRLAGGADAHARRKAAETSADLNEAVRVLRDPARRALYVLKLAGVDLDAGEAAARTAVPMEFLEEIIDRREALEAVKAKRDLHAALALAQGVREAMAASLAAGQGALRKGELPAATVALGRVRYYARFLEEVDAFEEELSS
jgi:molecular chaperone HscB